MARLPPPSGKRAATGFPSHCSTGRCPQTASTVYAALPDTPPPKRELPNAKRAPAEACAPADDQLFVAICCLRARIAVRARPSAVLDAVTAGAIRAAAVLAQRQTRKRAQRSHLRSVICLHWSPVPAYRPCWRPHATDIDPAAAALTATIRRSSLRRHPPKLGLSGARRGADLRTYGDVCGVEGRVPTAAWVS
jgi:hypothetical protein